MKNARTINTVGVLGVGRVGTAVARQAMRSGYTVNVAASGAAEDIELIVEFTMPGATAMTSAEVAAASDIVILATPLHRYRTLPVDALAGKTVIDAMNYWVPANGTMDEFEDADRGTSETVQEFLTGAKVAKSLNHIGYHDLETHARPAGAADRRALAVASDHQDATRAVMELIDGLGYDPVDAGPLEAGRAYQPDTTIFNGVHDAATMRELLDTEPATLQAA